MRVLYTLIALLFSMPALQAAIDVYEFDDPVSEQRFQALINELRCPKCQNQNIAGSDAPLAADLRKKVQVMIQQDRSDAEIVDYMVQRYGDFVTYRPPLKPVTWLLWFGPFVMVILIAIILFLWIRRRSHEQTLPLDEAQRARLQTLLAQSEDR